jgi:ADP-ribose pyrophosphatase YjhB (NUDIX family)
MKRDYPQAPIVAVGVIIRDDYRILLVQRGQVGEVATVVDTILRDESGRVHYHYVIVDYLARPLGGTLLSGSDASQARWFRLADLDGIEMTEKAGQLARQLLSGTRPG